MEILVLDKWIFVQFVNYILVLVVLNAVLIAPIRRMLKLRADHVAAKTSEIEGFTGAADGKIKGYEASLEAARREAAQTRMKLREEGSAQEKAMLEAAGAQAAATLKDARAKVHSESKAAYDTMLAGVSGMADKAASKILGQAL